eukprot:TRINITY_DN6894_c0_g1_i1.p1 TRINITY_DN6894_c0_g1~~TRINITY_DN6894_c0_g1_i1.p1  ORF type:complete len:323 (+),score=85.33 TRINITY_DN6894_c0_g1_i1:476-1444(+)
MADMNDLTQLNWLVALRPGVPSLELEALPAAPQPQEPAHIIKPRMNRKRKESSLRRSKSAVTINKIDADLERCLNRALSAGTRIQNSFSTAALIAVALLSRPESEHGAPSVQITRWIQRCFPKLRMTFTELKNSVRHELTSNRYFHRINDGKSTHQANWSIIPSRFNQLKQALVNGDDLTLPITPSFKRSCHKSYTERHSSNSSSDGESYTEDSELDLETLFETITKDDDLETDKTSSVPSGDWLVDEALAYSSEDNLSLSESEAITPPSTLLKEPAFDLPSLSAALMEEIDCTLPGVEPLSSAMSLSQFNPWEDMALDLVA